jgi:hypothetical protein
MAMRSENPYRMSGRLTLNLDPGTPGERQAIVTAFWIAMLACCVGFMVWLAFQDAPHAETLEGPPPASTGSIFDPATPAPPAGPVVMFASYESELPALAEISARLAQTPAWMRPMPAPATVDDLFLGPVPAPPWAWWGAVVSGGIHHMNWD